DHLAERGLDHAQAHGQDPVHHRLGGGVGGHRDHDGDPQHPQPLLGADGHDPDRVPPEQLEAAFDTVAEADAIVTVSPVYKVAPVGLHTLFWQLIDERALTRKPVLIASTGGSPRHSLAGETVLRPMLSYLKGIVVPTTVFAATDDWGSVEGGRALTTRIRQAGEEFVSLTST